MDEPGPKVKVVNHGLSHVRAESYNILWSSGHLADHAVTRKVRGGVVILFQYLHKEVVRPCVQWSSVGQLSAREPCTISHALVNYWSLIL